jgi:shikimate dehydrogenase
VKPNDDIRAMAQIDAKTRLFGVIGNPVAHSLSPVMHNAAFAAMDYPAVYLAFQVDDAAAAAAAVRTLNIKGLSVTIPYKIGIMAHLDTIDPLALKIGAVNTVVNRNGRLHGTNTDCHGAMAALEEKTDPRNRPAALLGAGGAARAVGFGLIEAGARVTVFNRGRERGQALADNLGVPFYPLEQFAEHPADIVINTTSVGMTPHAAATPVAAEALAPHMVVMDIVYNPLHTALLQAARAKGCATIDGVAMFVHQGMRQLSLWTRRQPPEAVMRQAVLDALMTAGAPSGPLDR